MRQDPPGLERALCPMASVLSREEKERTARENGVIVEAETGPSTQKLLEARKESRLELLEGAWQYRHLDFGLPASRTVRTHVCCVKTPNLWQLITEAEEINTLGTPGGTSCWQLSAGDTPLSHPRTQVIHSLQPDGFYITKEHTIVFLPVRANSRKTHVLRPCIFHPKVFFWVIKRYNDLGRCS